MNPNPARSWITLGIMIFLCDSAVSVSTNKSSASKALDAGVEKFFNDKRLDLILFF